MADCQDVDCKAEFGLIGNHTSFGLVELASHELSLGLKADGGFVASGADEADSGLKADQSWPQGQILRRHWSCRPRRHPCLNGE